MSLTRTVNSRTRRINARRQERDTPPKIAWRRPLLELLEDRTAPSVFQVVDLGTLGGTFSRATGVNDSGQVVGVSGTSSGSAHAFLFSSGQMTDLLPTDYYSDAAGINSLGQIAGDTGAGPFIFTPGAGVERLGLPPTGYRDLTGINDSGQVAGIESPGGNTTNAFVYSGGQFTYLGALSPGASSEARAINNSGQVTGDSSDGTHSQVAFVYSNAQMTSLGTLGGTLSQGWGINDLGHVVGNSRNGNDSDRAFLYIPTLPLIELGTLSGSLYATSEAKSINDSGQIVGTSEAAAFLWTPSSPNGSTGTMTDLNSMIPTNSGWTLVQANAINNNGQIVGYGISPSGQTHAFLLVPNPTVTPDNASVSAPENTSATNTGTFSNPPEAVTITASAGTVTQTGSQSGTWSWSGTGDESAPYTVTITATNAAGGTSTTSFTVSFTDVPPTVAADHSSVSVTSGNTATDTGTFADYDDAVSITASVGTVMQTGVQGGTWTWSLPNATTGQTVTITATNADRATSSTTFSLSTTINWINPAGGDWDTASNWDADRVPNSGDDAVINFSGITVSHAASAFDSVRSITSQAGLSLSGGSLAVGGTVSVSGLLALAGGTLIGGTILSGTTITATSGATLRGVTIDGSLDLESSSGAYAYVADGLTLNGTAWLGDSLGSAYGELLFPGTQTLGGTGTVQFGKNGSNGLYAYPSYATLTLGPGITVRGHTGRIGGGYYQTSVINQGTIAADNSGRVTSFGYDMSYSGGYTGGTDDPIDTSGVSAPAPEAVYQSCRYYPYFYYTLANLTAGASYTVRLHFAEPGHVGVGQRQFNVSINGTPVLTNFDIVATAGGDDRAVVEEFTATADANGQIQVVFDRGAADWPLVNGIEVDAGGSIVQAINCGEFPGAITINPSSSFSNQGTLAVSNGETLAGNASAIDNRGNLEVHTGSAIYITGLMTFAPDSRLNIEVSGTSGGGFWSSCDLRQR